MYKTAVYTREWWIEHIEHCLEGHRDNPNFVQGTLVAIIQGMLISGVWSDADHKCLVTSAADVNKCSFDAIKLTFPNK